MNFSQNTIRGILVAVILLTVPCYLAALVIYLSQSDAQFGDDNSSPNNGGGTILTATWTPIDPDALGTVPTLPGGGDIPVTLPNELETIVVSTDAVTPLPEITSQPPATDANFPTASPVPTRFITQTPSLTPLASNTPVPTLTPFPTSTPFSTAPPTATQPILLPPTDTPAP